MASGSLPAVVLAAVCTGGAGGPVAAEDAPTLRLHEHARALTVEAELPGTLLDFAPACGRDGGCRGVWLLVRPVSDRAGSPPAPSGANEASDDDATTGAPPRLLLLDPARAAGGNLAAALTDSALPLSPETDALALADLDGDGAPELLAGAPGRIWSLGDPAAPRPPLPVLSDAGVDLAAVRALLDPTLPLLPSPAVGHLRWYRATDGGGLAAAGSAPLPVRTRRRAHGLELSSPRPILLPAADGRPARWLVGPEPHGDRRLQTVLIDPLAADQATAESWSMLPGPESVESARYLVLDGRPALAVFTHRADRLGIFDQARLRLFRLGADRTRAGAAPILEVDTTSHRWQSAAVAIADLDADGHDDVSVAQVKGLGGKAILVETYRGLGGGRFARRPTSVRLDLPDADWRWSGGADEDFDGDGLPDLAALSDGRLLIYTGAGRRAGAALAERPRWELTFPESEVEGRDDTGGEAEDGKTDDDADEEAVVVEAEVGGEDAAVRVERQLPGLGGFPTVLDLDGDGRAELIFRDALPGGRERLRIVRLR